MVQSVVTGRVSANKANGRIFRVGAKLSMYFIYSAGHTVSFCIPGVSCMYFFVFFNEHVDKTAVNCHGASYRMYLFNQCYE